MLRRGLIGGASAALMARAALAQVGPVGGPIGRQFQRTGPGVSMSGAGGPAGVGRVVNVIRNSTMFAAVVGTPGTLPLNWSVTAAAGMVTTVVGTGIDTGLPYVDLQVAGTSTGTIWAIVFEVPNQIAATTGQIWSASTFTKLAGGALTNITSMQNSLAERNAAAAFLTNDVGATFVPTVAALSSQRHSDALTVTQATAAFIGPGLFINMTNGVAINVTVRIGAPQLERGAFANSWVPTP